MPVIYGTDGNDDGISNPALRSPGDPSVLYGYAGDDVLISSSRPFGETPDVLHGGTGNDRYVLGAQGSYFIYSTPIIWVPYAADVDIYEAPSETDTNDRLDMALGGYDIQTTLMFNGSDVVISTYARTIRIFDNYGVDAVGNLLAGVDFVEINEYSVASPLISHDLRLQGAEVTFVRNGTAGHDTVTGDAAGNVMDGRVGNDVMSGGGGNDFITGGEGDDSVDGGDGNDRLFGGSGIDSLLGAGGDDQLRGMTGDDHQEGGGGNDSYLYGLGDGHDTIADSAGTDAIVFAAGITQADVTISQVGGDLLITVGGGSIRVLGHSGGVGNRVEQLRFADGSTIDLTTAGNTPPDARDDAFTVIQGRSVAGNLFANNGAGADSDPNGDAISTQARSFVTANGGTVTIGANGAFSYTAAAGFSGADSLTYELRDSLGGTDTATVTINVLADQAPDARDDAFEVIQGQSVSGNLFADNGAGADSDPDGTALSTQVRSLTTANGGTVTIGANGAFTYTAAAGFSGVDTLTYDLRDSHGNTDTATITVNVLPNYAPDARDDSFEVIQGRTVNGNLFADNGAGEDSDPEGASLSTAARSFVTANGGTVTIEADGTFTYVAAAGFAGQDVLTYQLSDGMGGTDTASITINVLGNYAPVARPDSFAIAEDHSLTGNVLADNGAGADSDPNGDALTVTPRTITTARGGTVTIQANGSFVYTPLANFHGTDSFNYTVSDSFGLSSIGTATIAVANINDAPTAVADTFTIATTATRTGNLLLNDSDVDGDLLSAVPASFTTARGGVVTIGANGQYTYRNMDGLVGTDSFTYTVRDGNGGTSTATVTATLTAPAGAIVGTDYDQTITGTAGNDIILAQGGRDEVYGGLGADRIYGGAGNDDLNGDGGADQLFGGLGDDKLTGGAGNDVLIGGAGTDRLRGGSGADRFEFLRLDDGADIIDDFRLKDKDVLDLSDLLTAAFDPSQHRASDFVRITEVAGVSYVDVDADGLAGPAGWTRIATLNGVTGLTNEDALYASGHLILG